MNDETRVWSTIAGLVQDVTFAVDEHGCISYMNDSAIQIFGGGQPEGLGQPFTQVVGVDLPAEVQAGELTEYSFSSLDDEEGWVLGSWVEVHAEDGERVARVYVGRDVTPERKLQQGLVRSAALAELGLMAAEVAHEVNNPATYLMTNLSILRDDFGSGNMDSDSAIELIEECLDGISRITDIVKRMRSLATSSGEVFSDEMVELSTVVRDACRIAGLRVKYKADLHIHDTVSLQVVGSPKRLGQVVLNLVVNAADALSGQSDPMPRIDVEVQKNDLWAEVIVRDNGPGIPESMREKLFQPFVSSKVDKGGTGLGLAVSKTIAEEHDGTLQIREHEGVGAWFVLRLPLA
jgi:C4-dicarboxylate-specific signal transduction histidine kinase